jgi:hypothetical protein
VKICIIGSSHVASLKLGWGLVRDQFPEHEVTFFGAKGSTMRNLRPDDGKMVPLDEGLAESLAHTSGGLTVIEPGAYDAVVLHGLGLYLPRLRQGLSKAVIQETLNDVTARGLTLKIAMRLRTLTDQKLWISANPLEVALDDAHDSGAFYPYETLIAELERRFPVQDAVFLRQPPETIGPDLRAPQRFGSGSIALRSGMAGRGVLEHSDSETKHMNGEFGRFWMLQNLPLMGQTVAA